MIARRNPVIEAVRTEDRAASKAEGLLEGEIRGKIKAKLDALLVVLAARGIELSAARERIVGERDPGQLDRWIARAATASTLADVLDRACPIDRSGLHETTGSCSRCAARRTWSRSASIAPPRSADGSVWSDHVQ